MKLYSYTIPYDDGAAPNPFWGICARAEKFTQLVSLLEENKVKDAMKMISSQT
jgi:hypothetical protein